ncbi:MAG: ABC transporter permease [Cytophagia bacterium]|nr:ABC transporter permease [Cytophagia bacterium]
MHKIRHYIQTAFKNIKRNTGYTILMILSLALGMYCFVMSGIYVRYEYSRNLNHEKADRIYRVMLDFEDYQQYMPFSLLETIEKDNPYIEEINTMNALRGDVYLSADKESYLLTDQAFYTSSNVFDVFSFPLKHGNPKTALSGVNDIVISEELSGVLFPGENPVGESIHVDEMGEFNISGVMERISEQSIMHPDVFFSMSRFNIDNAEVGETDALLTHVLLKSEDDLNAFESNLWSTAQTMVKTEGLKGVYTESLKDTYWGTSHYEYGAQYSSLFGASKSMINTVMYITIGVLVCAFLGYVAIALSLSLRRAKEVGIRKVNGANVATIRSQLLIESVVYAGISLLITLVALEITETRISELLQVPIGLKSDQPEVILFLVAFTVITGLVAGLYPSLVVSKLSPVKVLSGFTNPGGKGFLLKRILLTSQFIITTCLVFGVYILKLQTDKMAHFDVGYNTENVIAFGFQSSKVRSNDKVVMDKLSSIPDIQQVAKGPFPFQFNGFSRVEMVLNDSLIRDNPSQIFVSENFFETMGISILEGKSFPESDSEKVCMVNQAFVDRHGLDNPVGVTLQVNGTTHVINGVVENYADWGVGNPTPLSHIFLPEENYFHSYLLKTSGKNRAELLESLQAIWKSYENVKVPAIMALDERKNGSVVKMSKMSQLFGVLAFVVLLLSFMNLFGMAVMFANSRIKSISIRKVLGASVSELVGRLSLPFFKSLIKALLFAMPLGYFFMEKYLQDYAVRITLQPIQGIMVALLMVTILFVVIGFKMLKIGKANPVHTLKEE